MIINPNIEDLKSTSKIAYPVAVNARKALLSPLGFSYTQADATTMLLRAEDDPSITVKFRTQTMPGEYKQKSRIRKSWIPAIEQGWGELYYSTAKTWRLCLSWWEITKAEPVHFNKEALINAPLRGPIVEQLPVDFGLFERQ